MEIDAIRVLERDHATLRKLFKALEKSRRGTRQDILLDKVFAALETHMQIEEEIFYPAFKRVMKTKDDRTLFVEAEVEHDTARTVIPRLRGTPPGSARFKALVKVLKELIEHHADEEESDFFPRARKLLSRERLVELGVRLEERTLELQVGLKSA
jgi:hemerythrin-like domain-containing protein